MARAIRKDAPRSLPLAAWSFIAAALGLLSGCAADGHLDLFGYTTAPPYDTAIRTVYVPIFENVSFRRGLEFELTKAVVREIEAKTPYKVVNCRQDADTELNGKIVFRRKLMVNSNQLGEVREAEAAFAVELLWRDLRPGHQGEFLSKGEDPRRGDQRKDDQHNDDLLPRNKYDRQVGDQLKHASNPNAILVVPTAHFIPELGGSVTSAENLLINRLAVQIVSMMERPW